MTILQLGFIFFVSYMQMDTKLEGVAFNEITLPIYSLLELVCHMQRYQNSSCTSSLIVYNTPASLWGISYLVVQALGLTDFEKECLVYPLPLTIIILDIRPHSIG